MFGGVGEVSPVLSMPVYGQVEGGFARNVERVLSLHGSSATRLVRSEATAASPEASTVATEGATTTTTATTPASTGHARQVGTLGCHLGNS